MTKKNTNKKTVAEIVTQRFIDALEKESIPWIKPWDDWKSWSRKTGDFYQGANLLTTSGGEYITFKQAKEEGIKINKGAKSEMIVKYTEYMKTITEEEFEAKRYTYVASKCERLDNGKVKVPARSVRYYNVFNVAECTDAEEKHEHKQPRHEWDAIEEAERIQKAYIEKSGISVQTAGNQPLYSPAGHYIVTGRPEQFKSAAAYYSTSFHELIHSTQKELNRETGAAFRGSDGKAKAREELVAEIGAAYLMSYLGIENGYSINNSEAYVKSWISNLKNDPNAILWAAPKAIEAAELILAAAGIKANQ